MNSNTGCVGCRLPPGKLWTIPTARVIIRAMLGTIDALFAATTLFVASHLLLSSATVRNGLVKALGPQSFTLVYSAVSLVVFVWMILAYGEAPDRVVWSPPAWSAWVPLVVTPLAIFLWLAGLTTRGPTAMGGETLLARSEPGDPAPGILRITRHPVMWGFALWALAHLASNGSAAAMILFGGLAVLALVGMHHIDQRREAALEAAWGPFALTTSLLPFVAIASGRTSFDWPGIGWARVAGALALYVVFLMLHELVLGTNPWPQ